MDDPAQDLIRHWGDHDFKFKLQAQGGMGNPSDAQSKNTIQRSLFQASILNAEAEEPHNPGIKVPVKCTWYRLQGQRSEKISEISSNVYQLSAKDLGCKIKVEAESLDPDFHGHAFGEFGPVQLDVYARQHLEQILGAGGNQFAVSVIMNNGGSSFDVKEESQEATLYINQHVLKISLKTNFDDRYSKKNQAQIANTMSFKYTVDYPKIELNPFDTKKFSILYNDTSDPDSSGQASAIDEFSVNLVADRKKNQNDDP